MKFLLLSTISLLASFLSFGQTKNVNDKIMSRLAELYNAKAYQQIYSLMSPDFKVAISEEQMTGFYQNSLNTPLGKIVSWVASSATDNNGNYTVQFNGGRLDVIFNANSKEEITGIQWIPAKKAAEPKKNALHNVATNNPKHTPLQKFVDSLAVDYLQNKSTCGISIGVISGDSTSIFFYGSENKMTEQLPDLETIYEIGSITKTFTGILLAHAINDGKIKAEDDIRKYLPGAYPNLQFEGMPIKVIDLSNHTSGLPRVPEDLEKQPRFNAGNPYKNYNKEMLYRYLRGLTLSKKPGTSMEYSNLGVSILGLIIETVYKESLDNLYSRFITNAAQMSHTKCVLAPNEQAKMATGYDDDGKEAGYWDLEAFNACGGLKSNMADMLKYLQVNMQETTSDIRLSHVQTYGDHVPAVGLNWMLSSIDGKNLTWHNGGTAGFRSFCGFVRETNTGVVILSNAALDPDYIALAILRKALKQ